MRSNHGPASVAGTTRLLTRSTANTTTNINRKCWTELEVFSIPVTTVILLSVTFGNKKEKNIPDFAFLINEQWGSPSVPETPSVGLIILLTSA